MSALYRLQSSKNATRDTPASRAACPEVRRPISYIFTDRANLACCSKISGLRFNTAGIVSGYSISIVLMCLPHIFSAYRCPTNDDASSSLTLPHISIQFNIFIRISIWPMSKRCSGILSWSHLIHQSSSQIRSAPGIQSPRRRQAR